MRYAVINNNTIAAHGTARQLWPSVSFPSTGPDANFLAEQSAVVIRTDPPYDPETQYLQPVEPYLLEGEVFNRQAAGILESPVPQWIAFSEAVVTDPDVRQMLLTANQFEPGLSGMLYVGLGKAADGDSRVFVSAWRSAVLSGLASGQLIAKLQAMAPNYDLPQDFIESLAPPPQI